MRISRIATFPIIVLCWAIVSPRLRAEPLGEIPTVRVALAQRTSAITVQANPLFCGLPTAVPETIPPLPNPRAIIRPTEAGLLVNEQYFDGNHLICRSGTTPVYVNGRPAGRTLYVYRDTGPAIVAVAEIPLDTYLAGVLEGELDPTWPEEALKAQAVAARSYAIAKRLANLGSAAPTMYDLESGIEDQVYRAGRRRDSRIAAAIASTRGEILAINRQPLKAYYHSCCGGMTEPAANVWGPEAAQRFETVRDPFCVRAPNARWRWTLTRQRLQELLRAAGHTATPIHGLKTTRAAQGERTALVTVETDGDPIQFSGNQFRRLVGFQELKSTLFKVRDHGNRWVFQGRGSGHGAGLCQWGAKGMAERGKGYQEILAFYYPGTVMVKWY